MRIAISTLSVIPNAIGGGEIYLSNLVRSLACLHSGNQFVLLVKTANQELFKVEQANFSQVVCPSLYGSRLLRVMFEQFIVPALIEKCGIELFHAPANTMPIAASVPTVLTLHYIPTMQRPYNHSWTAKVRTEALAWLADRSIRKASKIIAVSNHVRDLLLQGYGLPSSRVEVIYEGVTEEFYARRSSTVSIQHKEDSYVLNVSTTHPWKNVTGALRAYYLLRHRYGIKHSYLHVGLRGLEHDRVVQEVMNLGLDEFVTFKGYVPHDNMSEVYRNAALLVFPSYGETFGLPVLEAMASGVPVVASSAPAIPEIAGNAAILIDPHDIDGLAEAMYLVLTKPSLRRDLIQRGLERVRAFSWEETARKTLAVYEETYLSGS